jgi:hypothetical protein
MDVSITPLDHGTFAKPLDFLRIAAVTHSLCFAKDARGTRPISSAMRAT